MKYIIVLLLVGCSANPPKVVQVKIPYAVSCIEQKPTSPEFIADADLLNLKSGNFVTALHIDRLQRINYINELEAVLQACEYRPAGIK